MEVEAKKGEEGSKKRRSNVCSVWGMATLVPWCVCKEALYYNSTLVMGGGPTELPFKFLIVKAGLAWRSTTVFVVGL